jgi:hypothetical protein
LNAEDTIVLKEQLDGGFWKAEVNGRTVKLQISDVRTSTSPLSASEPGNKRPKKLNREKSGSGSKDAAASSAVDSVSSKPADATALPADSIALASPRGTNMVSSVSAPSLNIQAIVSNPNLGTPRKGQPTTPKGENGSLAPPSDGAPSSTVSEEQRNSFRKRASLVRFFWSGLFKLFPF